MSFESYYTVFCDSRAALEAAIGAGLARDCRVLTGSAFLHDALGSQSEFLRDRLTPAAIASIEALRPGVQRQALLQAQARPAISDYGPIAALMLLTSLDHVAWAACLSEADCSEPRLVIRAITGHAYADSVFNGPWDRLLGEIGCAESAGFSVDIGGFDPAAWGAPRGLFDRLRVVSWRRAAFRTVVALGKWWPAWSHHEALVISDNELLQETAFALALRGWSIRRLGLSPVSVELEVAEQEGLLSLCRDVLEPHLAARVVAPVREPLLGLIGNSLLSAAKIQKGAAHAFDCAAAKLRPGHRRVMLANSPAKPANLGFWHAGRKHDVPLFGFQHGVSCEICEGHDATFSSYETACSERAYTYNDRAAAIENANPDRHGAALAVGMPGDFRRLKRGSRFRRRIAPIVFASTAVYSGYWGRLWYGARTDVGMLEFERTMLEKVFAGLPHEVLYKRYPALRLLDQDPAEAAARAIPNIRVFSDFVDLRYLIGGCELLVSARATSTLSWCVMSGKPVVFVDIHDDMSLREDVRATFEDGLFRFSTAKAGWEADLHAFLSQPMADIRKSWRAKAAAREKLINDLFDKGGHAGQHAARDIAATLDSMWRGRAQMPMLMREQQRQV